MERIVQLAATHAATNRYFVNPFNPLVLFNPSTAQSLNHSIPQSIYQPMLKLKKLVPPRMPMYL
jgi:hypothetical protein